MSVRIRFVLILTLVVSLILLSSFFIIYTLYAHTREQDFNKRLWAQAYKEYTTYYNITDTDKTVISKLANYLPGSPIGFQSVLFDSAYNILFTAPKQLNYKVDIKLMQTIKELEVSEFFRGNTQGVGLYLDRYGHKGYVIATGYDKYGLARLASLRLIMISVAIGTILTIGLFALYYVIVVTRPLVNLSVQMRRITENNLRQRVDVGKGKASSNEIVQIALNFNNMLDRLDKAFQLQKNFVHHASHELRTPLATMMAQTESALRKNLTVTEAKEVLESLKEDQQEMIDLTNSLLLLSQYENISYSSNWPIVRIDEVIYDSIATAQKTNEDININFEFTATPEKEAYLCIQGNEPLLRSAFRNIIKNAYKYSDNKSLTITMEAYANAVHIHFDNTGPTINAEDIDRLFLAFFRGTNAAQKKGFGLGLAIVKRIIELHKGTVKYRVIAGNINRFTILFFMP